MMKKLLVLVMIALFATTAHAADIVGNKTLMKKLQEKGILSEDDIKEIEKDKKMKVELGGRLQIQFNNEDNDTETSKKNEFLVRRARLDFKATVSDVAKLIMQTEFGKDKVLLKDAYIQFYPGAVDVNLGQHYTPFSREAVNSSTSLQFAERNLTSQIAPYRQMGLSIDYLNEKKTFGLSAGVFDGALNTGSWKTGSKAAQKIQIYHEQNAGNDNDKLMYVGRVEFHPFGHLKRTQENFSDETKLAIEASFYTSDDKNVTINSTDKIYGKGSSAQELDVQYVTGGLDLSANYATRKIEWETGSIGGTADSVTQKSYTVQGSYLLTDALALAARYEYFDYADEDAKMTGKSGQYEDKWITAGVSYYFAKHHVKLHANYISKAETMPTGTSEPKNNQILVMAAYSF